jgi:hypothetical protein
MAGPENLRTSESPASSKTLQFFQCARGQSTAKSPRQSHDRQDLSAGLSTRVVVGLIIGIANALHLFSTCGQ